MSRHPGLYIVTLVLLICGHAALCYPAATCRGYPTTGPFWEIIAPFLVFCAVIIVPLFDDFDGAAALRRGILSVFTFVMALLFAVAITNLQSARPHIGYLAGYWGVLTHLWPDIIGNTVKCLFVSVPFVFCLEAVGRSLWSTIRTFEPRSEDERRTTVEAE